MDDDYNDDPHATKHEEYSTRCGCKSVFASSQDDITSELFDIGENLFFKNNTATHVKTSQYNIY